MRLVFGSIVALLLATGASAQERSNIPAGNPLGAGAPSIAPEPTLQARQRARLQAEARARANARAMADAFAPATPVAAVEPDAPRASAPSFTQSIGPSETAARPAPSPYGGYYQIRTPWDPR